MSIRVFEYGLLQPTSELAPIVEQIRGAHNAYNLLVEIERERRALIKDAEKDVPEVDAAKDVYKNFLEAIKEDAGATPDEKKRRRTAARRAFTTAKNAVLADKYAEVSDHSAARNKEAYAAKECFWGSYLWIQRAADLAVKTAKGDGPKFRRWQGEGALAVQLQRGMAPDRLFGPETRVRVDELPAEAWDKSVPRGQRNRMQRTVLHLRIGSEGRAPIWADWPMVMHRPLPEGSAIKWAVVIRRRRCNWFRWVVQLVIEEKDPKQKKCDSVVALNLGWRRFTDNTIRVAYWVDSVGQQGELRLPATLLERLDQAEAIRSHRDKLIDELKAWLVERKPELPEEVRKVIHLWRAPKRFVGLLRQEELPEEILDRIRQWHKRDLHLWQYETGCRTGALNHRRELYRLFVKELAGSYDVLAVENYNLTDIVTDPDRKKKPANQRVRSAPSILRDTLHGTGKRDGCTIFAPETKLATQACHVCGYGKEPDQRWDAAPNVDHICAGCGDEWDQDFNNATNLLARTQEAIKNGEALARKKPKKKARFAKRHKKSQPAAAAS
jgi:transposase